MKASYARFFSLRGNRIEVKKRKFLKIFSCAVDNRLMDKTTDAIRKRLAELQKRPKTKA